MILIFRSNVFLLFFVPRMDAVGTERCDSSAVEPFVESDRAARAVSVERQGEKDRRFLWLLFHELKP